MPSGAQQRLLTAAAGGGSERGFVEPSGGGTRHSKKLLASAGEKRYTLSDPSPAFASAMRSRFGHRATCFTATFIAFISWNCAMD